jgi:hypothetical protein
MAFDVMKCMLYGRLFVAVVLFFSFTHASRRFESGWSRLLHHTIVLELQYYGPRFLLGKYLYELLFHF